MKISLRNTVRLGALSLACTSSTAFAQAGPYAAAQQQFNVYRTAVAAWFADHPMAAPTGSVWFNPGMDPFELDPDLGGAGDTPLDRQMLGLAKETGILRAELQAARYPRPLYEPYIRRFEAETVRTMVNGGPLNFDTGYQGLVADINQARQSRRPNLPPLTYGIALGMTMSIPAIFRTNRPGGRVWIITKLRFEVCRAQISNPYDRVKCTKWRETDPQNPMQLSGTYVYQASWIGGGTRGMRTVEQGASSPVIYQVP